MKYAPMAVWQRLKAVAKENKESRNGAPLIQWGIPLSDEGKAKINEIWSRNGQGKLHVTSVPSKKLNASIDFFGYIEVNSQLIEKCPENEILGGLKGALQKILEDNSLFEKIWLTIRRPFLSHPATRKRIARIESLMANMKEKNEGRLQIAGQ